MVENEVIRKGLPAGFSLLLCALCAFAGEPSARVSWNAIPVDGSRTGVVASSSENVEGAMGTMEGKRIYRAPNGKVFRGGATAAEAAVIIGAQEAVADLKTVVGYSVNGMHKGKPSSPLACWAADTILEEYEVRTGTRADVSFMNIGGIRVEIDPGEVLKDDIISMFPFKNHLVLCTLSGAEMLNLFSRIALSPQAIGGARFTACGGKVLEATIGGKSVDPAKDYTLLSINFLLDGGDNFFLREMSSSVVLSDILVMDLMLSAVRRLTGEGKTLDCEDDNRIILLK